MLHAPPCVECFLNSPQRTSEYLHAPKNLYWCHLVTSSLHVSSHASPSHVIVHVSTTSLSDIIPIVAQICDPNWNWLGILDLTWIMLTLYYWLLVDFDYPWPLTLTRFDFDFFVDLWLKVKIFERAYLAQFFSAWFLHWSSKIGQLAYSSLWFLQRHSLRHLQVIFSCLSNLKLSSSFRLEFEGAC